MENKFLITKYAPTGQMLMALFEDGKPAELQLLEKQSASLIGNIYIGKVKNIVPNIEAAFVEIAGGVLCYFALEEMKNLIFTSQAREGKLTPGDEILVQVAKDAIKTKAPVVSSNLNLPGKYLVLASGNRKVGVSAKLSREERQEFKQLLEERVTEDFGLVVRTNAKDATKEELYQELDALKAVYERIRKESSYRTCFSLLYEEANAYIQSVRSLRTEYLQEIVTDEKEVYDQLKAYLEQTGSAEVEKLRFYDDPAYSMSKLYSLEKTVEDALRERVWLKSGGYLVIQPTEALTVIDVNTGKYDGKKNRQDTQLKINLEAAEEIAKQLRLRNLSGIIIVDFINMEEKAHEEILQEAFLTALRRDPVKTIVMGMTRLGLMELTRKKIRKPLYEQLQRR